MKRLLLALLLLPLGLLAQTGFEISGRITGLKDSTQAFLVTTTDNTVVASGPVRKGVFKLKGIVAEPSLFWLLVGDAKAQHLFVENTKYSIAGSKADMRNIKVTGSAAHRDFVVFEKTFTPLMAKLNGIVTQLNESADEGLKQTLMPAYDSLRQRIDAEVGNFVAAKQKSFVSALLLQVTAPVLEDPNLLEERFLSLDSTVRQTQAGELVAQYIAENKVGTIGSDAIDFTQSDTTGLPVALSSFKGKYVLIDFWASWCRPCRMENPNVVRAFRKFSDKNFTIIGVSLDKEKDAWLQAIKADGLAWTHVSDLQFWGNAVAQTYRVQSIPQNFLVAPSGKIIGKNLRGEDLEAKLCELLGCK
jgi:peroxiredoxin